MISMLLYLVLISLLVFWIERSESFSTNSLIIQKPPGELLEDWLKKFHWMNRSELSQSMTLPRYKFYTEVVETLLNLGRRMGGNYQDSLLFLREGLQADRQFEKKLKELILGAFFQMGLVVILTWAFILGALSMVEIAVSFFSLFFIFTWQAVGLGLLPLALKKLRKIYFEDIGKLWKMLYIMRSLNSVPLSRSEIFTMAGVQDLKLIHQKSLSTLVSKLKEVCQKSIQQGGSYEEEVRYLMEELRFQEKWHFELFEKRLAVIKLALLSLFFLPAYLAFIFFLLGDLMSLM